MASLIKQHGWYYVQFYDRDRRPRRKQIALKTKTKRTAEQLKRQCEDRYASGAFDPWNPLTSETPEKDLTLREAIGVFLRAKTHRAAETYKKYDRYLHEVAKTLPADFPVAKLEARHVMSWLDATKANDVTRRTYVRHLRVFTRHCVRRGLLERDVTEDVTLRRVPSKFPRWLRPEQVEQILAAIDRDGGVLWLGDVVLFAVHTGLRRGEIISLRWSAVDLAADTLTVENTDRFQTKSRKDRQIPLSDIARSVLEKRSPRRESGHDLVFTHSRGPIDGTYLSHVFKRFAREAGIENVRFHSLRHTACSWLASRGASVEAIRRFAGHSSIAVTEKYMHLSQDAFADQVRGALNQVLNRSPMHRP